MQHVALMLLLGAVTPAFPVAFTDDPAKPVGKPGIKVEVAPAASVPASEALAKALADAKAALARTRDYTGHLVRLERVRGTMAPETVAEIRVRNEPFAINLKTVRPLALSGEESSYIPETSRLSVRFRAAGVEGVKGFRTVDADGEAALEHARHSAAGYGMGAMIERVEKVLQVEQILRNPVAVYSADYKLGEQAVTRYEILAARPHPGRYAHRVVIYFDNETKLPARLEAYDAPAQLGGNGDLIEMQGVISLKTNVGLGSNDFAR